MVMPLASWVSVMPTDGCNWTLNTPSAFPSGGVTVTE